MTVGYSIQTVDEEHPSGIACCLVLMWPDRASMCRESFGRLYLDKPLKAHTLMQAIARANRVYEGKENGLIVDYCGILKNLREALAVWAPGKATPEGEDGSGPVGP